MVVKFENKMRRVGKLVFKILVDESVRSASEICDDDSSQIFVFFENARRLHEFSAVTPADTVPDVRKFLCFKLKKIDRDHRNAETREPFRYIQVYVAVSGVVRAP